MGDMPEQDLKSFKITRFACVLSLSRSFSLSLFCLHKNGVFSYGQYLQPRCLNKDNIDSSHRNRKDK